MYSLPQTLVFRPVGPVLLMGMGEGYSGLRVGEPCGRLPDPRATRKGWVAERLREADGQGRGTDFFRRTGRQRAAGRLVREWRRQCRRAAGGVYGSTAERVSLSRVEYPEGG